MKFTYTPQLLEDYASIILTPRLWATFKNPDNGKEVSVFGLVDSGATETLVHSEIGQALGLDVESGEKISYAGISGVVVGYRHKISMQIRGDKQEHEIECGFAPVEDVECLFGQDGFFDSFKVTFEKYKNQFEVTAKKK